MDVPAPTIFLNPANYIDNYQFDGTYIKIPLASLNFSPSGGYTPSTLTAAQANAATGDIRAVVLAICKALQVKCKVFQVGRGPNGEALFDLPPGWAINLSDPAPFTYGNLTQNNVTFSQTLIYTLTFTETAIANCSVGPYTFPVV